MTSKGEYPLILNGDHSIPVGKVYITVDVENGIERAYEVVHIDPVMSLRPDGAKLLGFSISWGPAKGSDESRD